ncbi:MAG: beta-propeller domain-containing protein [Candidatus Woesearchaeota archaeon]
MKIDDLFVSIVLIFLLSGMFFLTSCGQVQPDTGIDVAEKPSVKTGLTAEDLEKNPEIKTFSSDKDYEKFLSDLDTSSGHYGGYESRGMLTAASPNTEKEAVDTGDGGSSANEFSETNVQVDGVDEADIIKTDGDYIYAIDGDSVHIIKSTPATDAEVISTIPHDATPSGLFVRDDKLVVIGSERDDRIYETIGFRPDSGMTYAQVYDIADRRQPSRIGNYTFEGRYETARMTGDDVYIVLGSRPYDRPVHPMPVVMRDGAVESVSADKIHYFPMPYDDPTTVSAHSISLDGKSELEDSVSMVVDGLQEVYMSYDNLYIVGDHRISESDIQFEVTGELLDDELSKDKKSLIARIRNVDDDILSPGEKQQKIMNVYHEYLSMLPQDQQDNLTDKLELKIKEELRKIDHFRFSVINRVGYDDGELDLEATGKVPGRVINQFSLDESDEHLRIATIIDPRWSRYTEDREDSENAVWVLDQSLETVGSITGIAPDESIYSTRFINDRLYMVTFKQVDPFFVIDLADPRDPEILGELKITGFSRYLHPYDENHIIGLGKETTETGRTRGLKISLFNVEDVSAPKEVAKFVTDERYANSEALYEHKAFLFSKEKDLLVIPAYSRSYDGSNDEYNGGFVFNITTEDILLRGLIDHSSSQRMRGAAMERSLYIDNVLFTKSQGLLRANALEDLESITNVTLKDKGNEIPTY